MLGGRGLERTMKKTADTEHSEKITEARYKAIDRGKAEALLSTLSNYWRERQFYKTEDGDSVEGILLDKGDCYLLLRFWGKLRKPIPRGRPRVPSSSLGIGNPYKEEFERERQRIVSTRKKERGATKEAIAILAERHRVTFDAMRKRVRGK
jgi:hypothetical protein